MDEVTKKNLLNKKWVGERFGEFRSRKYGTPAKLQQLLEQTGISSVYQIESGKGFPQWETLVKVVAECGSMMSTFFAELEPTPETEAGDPDRKAIFDKLREILDQAPEDAQDWITGNIETFHKAYVPRRKRSGAD